MALDDTKIWGETHRNLPGVVNDGVNGPIHSSRFGELVTQGLYGSKLYALCDEGSYFVTGTTTAGTADIGIAASDGYDDAEAFLTLRNDATVAEGTRVYLDYLLLRTVAVGTNGTNFIVEATINTGATVYASGGAAMVFRNCNMQSSRTPSCTGFAGPVVLTTSTTERRIMRSHLRTAIKVAGDTYLFTFGDATKGLTQAQSAETTTPVYLTRPCPPIVLGPTDQFSFHEFASSQTVGASYHWELGFWVR